MQMPAVGSSRCVYYETTGEKLGFARFSNNVSRLNLEVCWVSRLNFCNLERRLKRESLEKIILSNLKIFLIV